MKIFESRKMLDFQKKSRLEKNYQSKKYFRTFFFELFVFVFVNYVNIAFQQAIGHYLTPFGRGERAI